MFISALIIAAISVGDLDAVSRKVNNRIQYQSDLEHYGKSDVWVTNPKDNLGDCEDYALTKAYELQKLGVKSKDMSIDIVQLSTNGDVHAVLEVRLPTQTYILDNLNPWAVQEDIVFAGQRDYYILIVKKEFNERSIYSYTRK